MAVRTTPVPALSPCAAFDAVHARYFRASAHDPEIDEVDYWPRVTVTNNTTQRAVVEFDGSGKATNPGFPDSPMEMLWGSDDGPLYIRPGATKTVDLGKQFGEVLGVFNHGRITRFKLTAQVSQTDDFVYGDGSSCPIRVTQIG